MGISFIRAFPSGFPIPFKNYLVAIQKPLSISPGVFLCPFSIAMWLSNSPSIAFPGGYQLKHTNFIIFSGALHFCLYLKNSSPYYGYLYNAA